MLDPKTKNIKERTYLFSLIIINLVKNFPKDKIYSIFTDQLLRSATSIGANLIEAKGSPSRKDFIKFYQIGLKSCYETIYWLCLLKDGKLALNKEKIENIIKEAIEISKMLGSSVLTLKGRSKT